jgi:NarL family two-component system response regulator LiaR
MSRQYDRIRIIAVDDLSVIRSGLRLFLMAFEDLELCGEAGSGEEAIQLCAYARPDIVLMDFTMPGMGGTAATRIIKQHYPQIQIIALITPQQTDRVQEILQAGAAGYLQKDLSAPELANAIRAAFLGEPIQAVDETPALTPHSTEPATTVFPMRLGHDLTEREQQVLCLIAEGLSNADIAARLVVSRSTVKFHISSIFSKLNVENRAEAITVAIQHGLIPRRAHA